MKKGADPAKSCALPLISQTQPEGGPVMSDNTPKSAPRLNGLAVPSEPEQAAPRADDAVGFLEKQLQQESPGMDAALRKSLARLGAAIAKKAVEELPAQEPPKAAEVIHLAFWGEDYRAAPNAVFRSALFPALNPKQKESRPFLKEQEIFSVGGLKVLFTGERFDQSDLDVYLEILHTAQPFPLGTPVKFSAHALLKALGLTTGGENHARLHSVLVRLRGGTIDATDHGKRYFGGLIESGIRDELTMNYEVRINPDFAVLFGAAMWGKLDLKTRRALGRKDVAKALQAYYSTHVSPGFHDLETLYGLTGLKGVNRKRDVLKAHAALEAVGFCEGYELNPAGTGIRLVNMAQHPGQRRAMVKEIAKGQPRRRQAMTAAADLLPNLPKTPKK
jgi:hypothetical protein